MIRISNLIAKSAFASVFLWSACASATPTDHEVTCVSPKANINYRNNSPYRAGDIYVDVSWKVKYRRMSTSVDADIDVLAVEKQVGSGNWASAEMEIWQLQVGSRGEIAGNPLRGNLADIRVYDAFREPFKANNGGIRLVAPDGGCAVQLAYPDGETVQPFSTIAVVGDSLTNEVVVTNLKSYAKQANANWRVHVDAQNGARWANYDDVKSKILLEQSGTTMIDELRGVAPYIFHNRALVVALGSNDIMYIGDSATRADEVKTSIYNVLKELTPLPTCVVLVTPPSATNIPNFNPNADIGAWLYSMVALGAANGIDPSKIRVVDFGAASKSHPYDPNGGPNSWFSWDTLHLNVPGSQEYARRIIDGVKTCYN